MYDENGEPFGFSFGGNDYYYVRNAQNDVYLIVDSNNQAVVIYQYDAWGNITNCYDTSSGNLISTLNPYTYRGYFRDSETGFYYLKSRYYFPEFHRFICADDEDISKATPMAMTDKNLFAYCDNNPIVRADDGGEFWHIIVGAVVGVAAQYVADVTINLINGQSFKDALRPTSTWADYGAAALSGALAATGIGFVASVAVNAAIGGTTYLVDCRIKDEVVSKENLIKSTIIGGVAGAIGGKGANGAKLRGVTRTAKSYLKTAVSQNKIVLYIAKIAFCKRIAVQSGLRATGAIITANYLSFIRKQITHSVA